MYWFIKCLKKYSRQQRSVVPGLRKEASLAKIELSKGDTPLEPALLFAG